MHSAKIFRPVSSTEHLRLSQLEFTLCNLCALGDSVVSIATTTETPSAQRLHIGNKGDELMTIEPSFACDMTAIAPHQRDEHIAAIKKLFTAVTSVNELPNGYKFELPNQTEILNLSAQFISLERLCCSFLGFTIEVEPEGGKLLLSVTGREGVKPFIMAEIGEHLRK